MSSLSRSYVVSTRLSNNESVVMLDATQQQGRNNSASSGDNRNTSMAENVFKVPGEKEAEILKARKVKRKVYKHLIFMFMRANIKFMRSTEYNRIKPLNGVTFVFFLGIILLKILKIFYTSYLDSVIL